MCVMNKQFEVLHFFYNSVYVDLKYNEISLTFIAGYVCLCGGCSHVVVIGRPWSVWVVVLVFDVDAVVAVTVIVFVGCVYAESV